jgi:hypothetical protein
MDVLEALPLSRAVTGMLRFVVLVAIALQVLALAIGN